MPSDRVFRVFLSSTFGDFRQERQALQSRVFPRLERYCAERGGTYQAVDLRWGISEQARKSHDTMRICLQEIRRCQELSPRPNFVALVGNRYGWQPVPAYIPMDQWQRLISAAQSSDQEIIRSAYSEEPDLNAAIPVFCLKKQIEGAKQKAVLRSALQRAALRAGFNKLEALNYFASATHHEIMAGVLSVGIQDRRVRIYMRNIHGLPSNERAKEFIDWDETTHMPQSCAQRQLEDMKTALRAYLPESIHSIDARWGKTGLTDGHIQKFCDIFYRHQVEAIDRELEAIDTVTIVSNNDTRERLNREFAEERTRHFTGREPLLAELRKLFSFDRLGGVYAVTGAGGCGKSALIAKLAEDCGAFAPNAPFSDQSGGAPPLRVCRFIGGRMGWLSSLSLLDDLVEDIRFKCGLTWLEDSPRSTSPVDRLVAALDLVSRTRPVWILIDGLDQLQNGQEFKEFLRRARWPNVTVVVSGRETCFPARDLSCYTQVFEVPPMTCEDGAALINAWLADMVQLPFYSSSEVPAGRRLTDAQRAVMLAKFTQSDSPAHGNPLWLKLAFEDARTWRSFDPVVAMPGSIEALVERFVFYKLLKREALRPTFTLRALAYINAGRFGLSDRELSCCLSMDEDVLAEFQEQERLGSDWEAKTLPPILWSRLFFELQPYLSEVRQDGSVLYRYFHVEFERAIKRICTDSCPDALIHGNVADVLRSLSPVGQQLFERIASNELPDPHAIRFTMEQPWQLAHAGKNDALAQLLTNFTFCMSKCAINEVDDLVDDFDLASGRVTIHAMASWGAFFLAKAHLLRRGNGLWPAHKILLQIATEQTAFTSVARAAKDWVQQGHCDWLWLRRVCDKDTLTRANPSITLEGHTGYVRGARQHPRGPIISWGQDPTIRIWEEGAGRCLATLEGHSDQIMGTGLVNDTQLFSWSTGNTIRLWDVSTGYAGAVLQGHQGRINGCIAIERDRLISWSEDQSIRVWDLNSGMPIAVFDGQAVGVSGVIPFSSDTVISWSSVSDPDSCSDAHNLRVWDLEGLACKTILRGHEKCVYGAMKLSDGTLLSWSGDGTLRIWNADSGRCLAVLSGFTGLPPEGVIETASGDLVSWNMGIEYECRPGINDAPPSPSYSEVPEVIFWRRDKGGFKATRVTLCAEIAGIIQREDGSLLSWQTDGTFSIWGPKDFTRLTTFGGGTSIPVGVYDSSGGTFISWHRDGTLRTWDSNEQVCTEVIGLHTGAILGYLPLDDERRLSWGADGNLRISTIETDVRSCTYPSLLARYSAAVLSPEGQILAVKTDHNVDIFNSHDGEKIAELQGHCDRVRGLRCLDDSRVLTYSDDATVRLWNSSTGDCTHVLAGHYDGVARAEEVASERVVSLTMAGSGNALKLWDTTSSKCLATWESQAVLSWPLLFTDRCMLIQGSRGAVDLWDLVEGSFVGRFVGHTESVSGALLIQDQSLLTWSSKDRTMRVWDFDTKRVVHAINVGCINEPVILPNANVLTSIAPTDPVDGSIRIWNPTTGDCVGELNGHQAHVKGVRLLLDGRLLSWGRDNIAIIWDLSTGEKCATHNGQGGDICEMFEVADGKVVYSTFEEGLFFWEPATGHSGPVTMMDWKLEKTFPESLRDHPELCGAIRSGDWFAQAVGRHASIFGPTNELGRWQAAAEGTLVSVASSGLLAGFFGDELAFIQCYRGEHKATLE